MGSVEFDSSASRNISMVELSGPSTKFLSIPPDTVSEASPVEGCLVREGGREGGRDGEREREGGGGREREGERVRERGREIGREGGDRGGGREGGTEEGGEGEKE